MLNTLIECLVIQTFLIIYNIVFVLLREWGRGKPCLLTYQVYL